MDKKGRIGIIGAGVGGLASALRLSRLGYEVEVFEKLAQCGGRNHLLEDRGFKFDMGPSFVLMPDLFGEIFLSCSKNINNYLDLRQLEVNYKIFYPDGDCFTVYKDINRTKEQIEKIEAGGAKNFDKFLLELAGIYKEVKPLLYKCFTPASILQFRYWKLLSQLKITDSYWSLARKYFKNEKLLFAFTFEAMFMGVSPFDAPAFYSIITYVDHVQKIAHPMGGMYQIPMALEKLAKEFGTKFHYNTQINSISRKNGVFLLDSKDNKFETDKTIVNADYAYTQSDLLKRRLPEYKYSCSVYLLYLGLKKKIKGLQHHNLFFAKDLKKNLQQIFKTGVMPEDPSFYVHVPTVTDNSLAPQGKEILYILVPVPNLRDSKDIEFESEAKLRKILFDTIDKAIGEKTQDLIEVEHKFFPKDFILRYNIKFGATFGLAHNLMQSAFFRPANFDAKIKNLYYVGASTQPGGGLPVVIAGSKIVADLISLDGL